MLTKTEFNVLRFICENPGISSKKKISQKINIKLIDLESILSNFKSKSFIDDNLQITSNGMNEMEPYRVRNAIILAAGMSTRFVPVSYELPKGLISVKGDVLTERLIEQLQDAGIREIILVVGYMMEKFFYLRTKYNVKIVVNNEYATKNTHSSIYAARDFLSNTYICCADNYYPENMFHQYEYKAFYCSVFLPGISHVERAFTFDENDLIIDTNKPSNNQWIMYGHAYYDMNFTSKFKPILESYYGRDGVEQMYWETIYAENVKELPMYIHRCSEGEILEFDSMEELKKFDKDYIANNKIKIFENICKILCCEISDIKDIVPIKKGLANRSFKFFCNDQHYIYRHPGQNAANVVDRKKEAISLRAAKKNKIDDTLLYIDEEEGWKISKFVETSEEFDFSNTNHIALLAKSLKKLHKSNTRVGFNFDYCESADKLIKFVKHYDGLSYKELVNTREKMKPIFSFLKKDPWPLALCHNDLYEPNLLIEKDKLHIIDWEFAGDSDIGFDICKLFAIENPGWENIDNYLKFYYKRPTTEREKVHLTACAAIIYYYWFVWAVYVSKIGGQVSEYLMIWYDKMNSYCDQVLNKLIVSNEL